jgi:hypothetical protein
MDICNIGHDVINTPNCDIHLNNVLHVPNASKILIFIHHFSNDNLASLEYFPNHFLIKDLDMRKVLLEGQCKDGLYPLPTSWRQVFGTFKPMLQQWHSHLGHRPFHVIEKLVKNNNLLCSSEYSNQYVCDACLSSVN